MISKLAVVGRTRAEAIGKLRRALREYEVGGIKTTLAFFREIIEDREFIAGNLDTGFIGRWLDRREKPEVADTEKDLAIVAAALAYAKKQKGSVLKVEQKESESRWAVAGRLAAMNNRF
jgi:acetyl-CoA carboxylase biotin carboxylase subunit